MDPLLNGLNVAILVADGFEQVEFTEPKAALEREGAITKVVSSKHGKVQGMHHDTPGEQFDVDLTFNEVDPKEFHAFLLPGGALSAGQLRHDPEAQVLVRGADEDGKPIAVICHGAWLLLSAGLVTDRTLTSWPDLQEELRSGGAHWIDQPVVLDGNWVSSRMPEDIPGFVNAMIERLQGDMRAHLRGTPDEHAIGIASS
jgi:protease I